MLPFICDILNISFSVGGDIILSNSIGALNPFHENLLAYFSYFWFLCGNVWLLLGFFFLSQIVLKISLKRRDIIVKPLFATNPVGLFLHSMGVFPALEQYDHIPRKKNSILLWNWRGSQISLKKCHVFYLLFYACTNQTSNVFILKL